MFISGFCSRGGKCLVCAKFKGGQTEIQWGGEPHIKDRESQLLRGEQINPKGGRKHPLAPPEINPALIKSYVLNKHVRLLTRLYGIYLPQPHPCAGSIWRHLVPLAERKALLVEGINCKIQCRIIDVITSILIGGGGASPTFIYSEKSHLIVRLWVCLSIYFSKDQHWALLVMIAIACIMHEEGGVRRVCCTTASKAKQSSDSRQMCRKNWFYPAGWKLTARAWA